MELRLVGEGLAIDVPGPEQELALHDISAREGVEDVEEAGGGIALLDHFEADRPDGLHDPSLGGLCPNEAEGGQRVVDGGLLVR
jgi:hypothetical protein